MPVAPPPAPPRAPPARSTARTTTRTTARTAALTVIFDKPRILSRLLPCALPLTDEEDEAHGGDEAQSKHVEVKQLVVYWLQNPQGTPKRASAFVPSMQASPASLCVFRRPGQPYGRSCTHWGGSPLRHQRCSLALTHVEFSSRCITATETPSF